MQQASSSVGSDSLSDYLGPSPLSETSYCFEVRSSRVEVTCRSGEQSPECC